MPTRPIEVGDRFRAAYADARPLWEVTGRAGARSWHAEVRDLPYRGATDVFGDLDIRPLGDDTAMRPMGASQPTG